MSGYGYEEHIEIIPEQILQKVSQQKIFEFILKEPFNWSYRYRSPFREHSRDTGTCRFEEREDGTILFVDFGERFLTGRTHRTCFRMVMDKFNCSLIASVKIIADNFKLSLDRRNYKEVDINNTTLAPIEYERRIYSKSGTDITFIPKDFTKYDVKEWSRFLIKTDHLIEDNVYSVKRYSLNSDKGFRTFTPYLYCYAIDFVDAIKIYQPHSIDHRFITNCNENHIGNIDNIPETGDELVIQKSYKDHRVLRNLEMGLNVIWFANETCVPSIEILANLASRFRLITLFYDNDLAGILGARKLAQIFNELKEDSARAIHLPERSYKDPALHINKEGRADLIQVLKQIKLL